jgi:hypothetical protein
LIPRYPVRQKSGGVTFVGVFELAPSCCPALFERLILASSYTMVDRCCPRLNRNQYPPNSNRDIDLLLLTPHREGHLYVGKVPIRPQVEESQFSVGCVPQEIGELLVEDGGPHVRVVVHRARRPAR